MREITLADGSTTQVSDEDFDYLNQFQWHRSGAYVITTLKMHRLVADRAGIDSSIMVDHRDQDVRNNQRNNLRAATRSQNRGNSRVSRNNKTGFKGVTFDKRRGKYCAQIRFGGHNKHLGYFDRPEDANAAYFDAAQKVYGEFANQGFPPLVKGFV